MCSVGESFWGIRSPLLRKWKGKIFLHCHGFVETNTVLRLLFAKRQNLHAVLLHNAPTMSCGIRVDRPFSILLGAAKVLLSLYFVFVFGTKLLYPHFSSNNNHADSHQNFDGPQTGHERRAKRPDHERQAGPSGKGRHPVRPDSIDLFGKTAGRQQDVRVVQHFAWYYYPYGPTVAWWKRQ